VSALAFGVAGHFRSFVTRKWRTFKGVTWVAVDRVGSEWLLTGFGGSKRGGVDTDNVQWILWGTPKHQTYIDLHSEGVVWGGYTHGRQKIKIMWIRMQVLCVYAKELIICTCFKNISPRYGIIWFLPHEQKTTRLYCTQQLVNACWENNGHLLWPYRHICAFNG
jgi:hypothetical protein